MDLNPVGILLVNLGSPAEPTAQAVKTYLAEFLSDKRIVSLPRLLWMPVLHGIILRKRPAKSAQKYKTIWLSDGSPLVVHTQALAHGVQFSLDKRMPGRFQVSYAMRYGEPAIQRMLDEFAQTGIKKVLFVPLYPQYSTTTTASALDMLDHWREHRQNDVLPLDVHFVHDYHDNEEYIHLLASSVQKQWKQTGRSQKLVMSFHGIPQALVDQGDPYALQCHATAQKLVDTLGLSPEDYVVTFQSRFGKGKWLQPATHDVLLNLAQQGVTSVDVICPGFAADCLETLEEINMECREAYLNAGGKGFYYIPCLNADPAWVNALSTFLLQECDVKE